MKFLTTFGITQRLYLVSLALIGGLGLVALLAWSNISGINRQTQRVAEESVPHQLRLATMELNVTRSSLQLRHAIHAASKAFCSNTAMSKRSRRKSPASRSLPQNPLCLPLLSYTITRSTKLWPW